MKRRDFLKRSAIAGLVGLAAKVLGSARVEARGVGERGGDAASEPGAGSPAPAAPRTPPDENCRTLPDGSCVGGKAAGGKPCMHDPLLERFRQMQQPVPYWTFPYGQSGGGPYWYGNIYGAPPSSWMNGWQTLTVTAMPTGYPGYPLDPGGRTNET